MTETNKALELILKKTTLRVLNVDELALVGGADDTTENKPITPTITVGDIYDDYR